MKKTMTACLTLLLLSKFSAATERKFEQKQIVKYERFQEHIVVLPTNFAKPFIIDQQELELISGKRIAHIDLVYTKFRASETFDQQRLNDRRIVEIKRLLPQLLKDQPTWAMVEQTGAKTRDEAATYFHGFVIHYSNELDHASLQSFFSNHTKNMTEFTLDIQKGGTFAYPSGTIIKLPPNAVTYTDGTPISGSCTIQYREFRNPAEIALSGLPMTYKNGGAPYNFSSVGMYEIRGSKDGKELKLQKPAEIDFNCTKVVDDAAFFQMDDKNGNWQKVKDIDFKKETVDREIAVQPVAKNIEAAYLIEHKIAHNGTWLKTWTQGNKVTIWLDESAWENYEKLLNDSPEVMNRLVVESNPAQFSLTTNTSVWEELNRLVLGDLNFTPGAPLIVDPNPRQNLMVVNHKAGAPNQMNATMLGAGSKDPGHTYPTIVAGLNNPNFGVYNCDQIYRLGTFANLSPVYTDAGTGKAIENKHVACVIDLTYNGSFSFQPNNILCNTKGRNVVLLFTEQKEIYMLAEADFAKLELNQDQRIDFKMTNVTSQLNSSDDLKKMLHL